MFGEFRVYGMRMFAIGYPLKNPQAELIGTLIPLAGFALKVVISAIPDRLLGSIHLRIRSPFLGSV